MGNIGIIEAWTDWNGFQGWLFSQQDVEQSLSQRHILNLVGNDEGWAQTHVSGNGKKGLNLKWWYPLPCVSNLDHQVPCIPNYENMLTVNTLPLRSFRFYLNSKKKKYPNEDLWNYNGYTSLMTQARQLCLTPLIPALLRHRQVDLGEFEQD